MAARSSFSPSGPSAGGTQHLLPGGEVSPGEVLVLSQFFNGPTMVVARSMSGGTLGTSFKAHGPVPGLATRHNSL